ETPSEAAGTEEGGDLLARRFFLRSMGKWSGAAITAALLGGAWLGVGPGANAGGGGNRRGGGGGGGGHRDGGGGGGRVKGRGGGRGGGGGGGGVKARV